MGLRVGRGARKRPGRHVPLPRSAYHPTQPGRLWLATAPTTALPPLTPTPRPRPQASFEFTAGALYTAAPLTVETTLTTEASDGVLRRGVGQRMSAEGRARLVGVARVPRTEDALLNAFLQLPTDALAVLSAELDFA